MFPPYVVSYSTFSLEKILSLSKSFSSNCPFFYFSVRFTNHVFFFVLPLSDSQQRCTRDETGVQVFMIKREAKTVDQNLIISVIYKKAKYI